MKKKIKELEETLDEFMKIKKNILNALMIF